MPGLQDPLTAMRGVGPALAEKLARLGAARIEDLLFQLPIRYEDRTSVTPLGSVRSGQRAVVHGEILLAETVFRGRRALICRISDGTGQLTLRFFHFSNAQRERFVRGAWISCYGDVRPGPQGPEMVHPEYRISRDPAPPPTEDRLTPVYPVTDGVHQNRMRQLVGAALALLRAQPAEELLPASVRDRLGLPTLGDAIEYLHRPPPGVDLDALSSGLHPCQRRLALEELLAQHLSLRQLKHRVRSEAAVAIPADADLPRRFVASLPFRLTAAQQRVLDEIGRDMAVPHPMLRLVQGDVGSGKTVVAAAACLAAIDAGLQCALMAPTELLAEQHARNFNTWLEPLGVSVAWLSGSLKAAPRRAALGAIGDGSANVVVGTHALFQAGVEFAALGLIVIDEQHRFGVHQRLALREKGAQGHVNPHQLVMTATPIPRTLAMTAYADLDTSVIDELPPGRTPVETVVIPESRREEVVERVRSACAAGRQAYWVCPLVEESEVLEFQAAEASFAALEAQLPELSVGLVHGRMKPDQKEAVMARFGRGEVQLLVATTVIEVGVDVPNASLMIIENAERMGLSQLHQLRGRVGRGEERSSCVLLYRGPLSQTARSRLSVMRETNDGFLIAQRDLELRGPGEMLGTRQTGAMSFRIADLTRDADLLVHVQRIASELYAAYDAGGSARIRAITDRWIGGASRYGNV